MKVFVTHSYFYQLDPKQWKNKTPFPPLGTITALAALKEQNYNTEFYDVALDSSPALGEKKIINSEADVVVIYDDGFNYLTKMCLTNMRHACFELIAAAKTIGAKVIVSSSDSTDHYEMYHDKGADIVLEGEGEMALLESLDCISEGKRFSEIGGISYLKTNQVIKTDKRLKLKELDSLPTADWESIDIASYKAIWGKGKSPFSLNISTTRGCPFKCNWCAKPIYGNRYNSRSPKRVVEEIQFLSDHFDTKYFWMTDDIFGLKPGWVTEFNQLLKDKNLSIHYKIQSRADLMMKDNTIDELAESGLEEAWLGAESGSQKILDAMDKGITLSQIKESTQLLQKKGIRVAYFLQFGYLGENKADINATLSMVKDNTPDDIGISVSYPLPGTPFFEKVKEQMVNKSNWKDSDDLDLMFEGEYSSKFYKNLQRHTHHLFRFRQGIRKIKSPNTRISWRYVALIPYNLMVSMILKPKF